MTYKIETGEILQRTEYNNSASGSQKTIDWNKGRIQRLRLTEDCVLTFIEPHFVGRFDIRIIQDEGGEHTPTFPANVIFVDGEPEWTQGLEGDEIIISFRYDGTKYVAFDSGYYEVPEL
jgi:hypothetical protein